MSASRPVRASVIIVGYNSRQDLEQGLPGILASLGEDDELILVDNASEDGTAAWVRKAYPNVRLLLSEENTGFGGANNLAAGQALGEYLAFINPDTNVNPGWLDALLGALQTNPGVQLATSRIVLMSDRSKINTCGNDMHISGITLCRGMGKPAGDFVAPAQVGAVSGAAFAMRRAVFLELGGFDAEFFLYMEDADLSLRSRLAGYGILFVPDSVVEHAYELRFGPSKTFYQERNRYLMLLKAFRWGTLFVLLPVFLLSEMVTWGYTLLREPHRLGNKVAATGWVINNWRGITAARRKVQDLRRVPDRTLIAGMTSRLEIDQVDSGWLGQTATSVFSFLFSLLRLWTRCWVWW